MLHFDMPPRPPLKARLSSKGQLVIPRALRKALGLRSGTEFTFRVEPDGDIVLHSGKPSLERFFGAGKRYAKKNLTVRRMDKLIMQAVRELDDATRQ